MKDKAFAWAVWRDALHQGAEEIVLPHDERITSVIAFMRERAEELALEGTLWMKPLHETEGRRQGVGRPERFAASAQAGPPRRSRRAALQESAAAGFRLTLQVAARRRQRL